MKPVTAQLSKPGIKPPQLAFVGLGWIGRNRLEAIAKSGCAEIARLSDIQHEAVLEASIVAPHVVAASSFAELLEGSCDGIVIATPNSFHAEQAIAALANGIAVFCQKPLGRDAIETRRVVTAARRANCLLGVDLSYRFIPGMRKIRDLIAAGELGRIFASELKFHNAYGPDKAWFYDRKLSGGGCVIDLGTHLVDLGLWMLGFPRVVKVSSSLFAQGELLQKPIERIEDYTVAQLELEDQTILQLACSWKLSAGCDADIEISFHGTKGGARLRNLSGSFYDFVVEHLVGTRCETLSTTVEDSGWAWGGLALEDWCHRLASGVGFDVEAEHLITVAEVIDQVYGRASRGGLKMEESKVTTDSGKQTSRGASRS